MDTIEAIEKDYWMQLPSDDIFKDLQLRILIQIAYQLRVLAQKGVG